MELFCPVCATTKALVKIPRDPATRRYQEPGELIHVDTWGPYPVPGWDKTRFFLLATDDAKRFTWCERFIRKDDLIDVFVRLHKRLEKAHGFTIRRYRTDNEFFRSDKIKKWYEKHSITLEITAPYAHHQNGVSERGHRTEREKTAAMLQENTLSQQIRRIIQERGEEMLRNSNIPESLWPEAFEQAVWLKNRSPTRALKNKKTPWESLESHKPDLSRERIWGSRAYVTRPPEVRAAGRDSKLTSPRGWLGYFVGCESESIYRIWEPEKKKVLRISVARIDDGEGLDDDHEDPNINQRVIREPEMLESISEDALTLPSEESELSELSESEEELADEREVMFATKRLRSNDDTESEDDSKDSSSLSDCIDSDPSCSAKEKIEEFPRISALPRNPAKKARTWASRRNTGIRGLRPDDSKCERCFRRKRYCDGERPCGLCTQVKHLCKDQDELSKLLIPEENRDLSGDVPQAQDPLEKCHRCFHQRCFCDQTKPNCGQCTKHGKRCHSPKAKHVRQDASAKCQRCLDYGYICDGQKPKCGRCARGNHPCRAPTRPKKYHQNKGTGKQDPTAKCHHCLKRNRRCDGNRPAQHASLWK